MGKITCTSADTVGVREENMSGKSGKTRILFRANYEKF